MLLHHDNKREENCGDNQSSRYARNQVSGSKFKQLMRGCKRYWFIALPAIMLNVGITLDHVIAKNNANFYRVRIKEVALEALEASKTQDDAQLSDTLRAHWITTNKDGNLEGRISAIELNPSSTVPIEKLDVALLRKGEKIRNSSTDNNGRFTLNDVSPGVYTLIAAGQSGFLAYGVNVLPKIKQFDVLEGNTNVDPQKLKHEYYVSHFNVPQDSVVVENLQIDAAAVPPEYNTLQRISQNYLPPTAALSAARDKDDAKAIGKATNIRNGFKHPLSPDGSFEGRIQPIASSGGKAAKLSEMNIFLIQDDIEAARVAVEENGKFKIEDIDPGVYSLVAAGKDGFAALSVELEEDFKATSSTAKPEFHYVSSRAADPSAVESLGIAIVTDPDDIQVIKQEINRIFNERQKMLAQQDQANPIANQGTVPPVALGTAPLGIPAGTGTTGTTMLSGGAGGTRRGGFLLMAGLTAGVVALAIDDDDDSESGGNPPPMSPTMPISPPPPQTPPAENPMPMDPPNDNQPDQPPVDENRPDQPPPNEGQTDLT